MTEERKDAGCILYAADIINRLAAIAAPESAEHLKAIADRLMTIGGRLALDALSTWSQPGEFDLLEWQRQQLTAFDGNRFKRAFHSTHGTLILDELQAAMDEHVLTARRKAKNELRAASTAALKFIEQMPALAALYKKEGTSAEQ